MSDLKAKFEAAIKSALDITEAAKAAGRALTEDEATIVEAKHAEAVEIKSSIEAAAKTAGIVASLGSLALDAEVEAEAKSAPAARAKTLGDAFVAEKGAELKGVKGSQSRSVSYKAATDPTTTAGLVSEQVDTAVETIRRQRPTVASRLNSGTLTGNVLRYTVEIAREGDPGSVAEAGQKPKVHYRFEQKTETPKKIAVLADVSDEMLEDFGYVASTINNLVEVDFEVEEDKQLLLGDGTGNDFEGLLERDGIQTESATFALDNADALHRAITKIATATDYAADTIFIHPLDFQKLRLQKDLNGNYIGGSFWTASVNQPIWGITVVQTTAIPAGTAAVIAGTAITFYRKGSTSVDVSYENKDNFEKNLATIRAEGRGALQVKKPAAIVKVTFSDLVSEPSV